MTSSYSIINYKEEKFYISCCPELGLTFKGKTAKKAFDGPYHLLQLQFPPPATFPSFSFSPFSSLKKICNKNG